VSLQPKFTRALGYLFTHSRETGKRILVVGVDCWLKGKVTDRVAVHKWSQKNKKFLKFNLVMNIYHTYLKISNAFIIVMLNIFNYLFFIVKINAY